MTKPTTNVSGFPFSVSAAYAAALSAKRANAARKRVKSAAPTIEPHAAREAFDLNEVVESDASKRNAPSRRKRATLSAPSRPEAFTAAVDLNNYNVQEITANMLIAYLTIKPNPSDEEVHYLAAALGVPKETLEEVIYNLLAEYIVGAQPTVPEEDTYTIYDPLQADADDELPPEVMDDMMEESDSDLSRALAIATTPVENDTSDAPNMSTILNPTNTDERLSSDGEPDPYSIDEIRRGAPTR